MILPGAEKLYYLGRKQGNVTQRSKPSGKHALVMIQNNLTFLVHKEVCCPLSFRGHQAFVFS